MIHQQQPVKHDERPECLLALPRELRDQIYAHLLDERRQPPDDPGHAGGRNSNSSTIYFETRFPKPALLQLKLCCYQTYAEVTDLISSHADNDSQAHLDIMVRGSSIYPTWVYLPVTTHIHPTIKIDLRLFEAAGWGSEFNTGAYRGLWSLFWSLVFQGPSFMHNTRGLPTPLLIDALKFNIRFCFPTSVDDLFGTYRDVFDRLERLASDNVGLGHVGMVEACFGNDRRAWRLKQLPTGLTFASRV